MSEPFIGEIRLVAFTYPPRGWAHCDGSLLSINQNTPLFAILGTTYGGNGTTTFALPDLRGRVPVHTGTTALGAAGGEEQHALIAAEMPVHTHSVRASNLPASLDDPTGAYWAAAGPHFSAGAANTTMNPASVSTVGTGAAHPNMQPYLALNFVIALVGIFPSRI